MADRAWNENRRLRRAALIVAWLAWPAGSTAATVEALVHDPTGAPIEDAAVVLEPWTSKPAPHPSRATIEQRNREFSPYLSIVQTGTAIDFPNRDPVKHHVYSFSPAKIFEIKLYAGKPANPVIFDRAGEVVLGCNIHDWMEAHVLVVDTPWFAKTGADGRARIDHLPAGAYQLRLWHPRQKTALEPSRLDIGSAPRQLEFSLEVAPRPPGARPASEADGY